MHRNYRSIITAIIIFGINRHAAAQAAATAAQGICTPASVTRVVDMHFGNAGLAATRGAITISPYTRQVYTNGAAVASSIKSAVSAAAFSLTGQPYYIYAISLPRNTVLTDGNAHVIPAHAFTCFPGLTGMLDAYGRQLLSIGATFLLSPTLPSGTYANTATRITINYN